MMHLYEVTLIEGGPVVWKRTLGEAHHTAKATTLQTMRSGVRIVLKDYPSDQQTVCDLFNGNRPEGKALRTWNLTARGGLNELKDDGREVPVVVGKPSRQRSEHPTAAPDAANFWAELEARTRK